MNTGNDERDFSLANFQLTTDDMEDIQLQTALAMSMLESQSPHTEDSDTEYPFHAGDYEAKYPTHTEDSDTEYPFHTGDYEAEYPTHAGDSETESQPSSCEGSAPHSLDENEAQNVDFSEDFPVLHHSGSDEEEVEWVIESNPENTYGAYNPDFNLCSNEDLPGQVESEEEDIYTSANSGFIKEEERKERTSSLQNISSESEAQHHYAPSISAASQFSQYHQSSSQSQTSRPSVARTTRYPVTMATANHDSADFEPLLKPFPLSTSTGLPVNWEKGSDSSETSYKLFKLPNDNFECKKIREEFGHVGIEVVSVERVQNWGLLQKYKTEMGHMSERRPEEFELNERYLYHGTTVDKCQMCEEGLDFRLSRKGHFGKGTYFSDNPLKCLKYSSGQSSGQESGQPYILKCRVLLGDMKIYSKGQKDLSLVREPAKENPKGNWKYYDSVKGCPRDYNEFVIYENRRLLVEYIITYKPSLAHSQSSPAVSNRVTTVPPSFHNVQSERTLNRTSSNSSGNLSGEDGGEADDDVNPEVRWLAENYGEEFTNTRRPPARHRERPRSFGSRSRSPGSANGDNDDDSDLNPEVNYDSDGGRGVHPEVNYDGDDNSGHYFSRDDEQTERKGVVDSKKRRRRRPPKPESSENNDEAPVAVDSHQQRLEEVRREVRRKRLQEQAAAQSVAAPDSHQRQLALLHQTLLANKARGKDKEQTDKLLEAFEKTYGKAGLQVFQQSSSAPSSTTATGPSATSSTTTSTVPAPRGSFQSLFQGFPPPVPSPEPEEDPVDLVLNNLIKEFLVITNISDSAKAKSYVQRANHDIAEAIDLYYAELS